MTITEPPAPSARAVVVFEILVPHLDGVAVFGSRFGLGHPRVREFRIGERAPRHHRVHPAFAGEEHVPDRAHSLVGRGVSEQVATGDIAARVDVRDARTAAVVDGDATIGGGDTERIEPESFDVRGASDRNEQLLGFPPGRYAGLGAVHDLAATFDRNAFGFDFDQ